MWFCFFSKKSYTILYGIATSKRKFDATVDTSISIAKTTEVLKTLTTSSGGKFEVKETTASSVSESKVFKVVLGSSIGKDTTIKKKLMTAYKKTLATELQGSVALMYW